MIGFPNSSKIDVNREIKRGGDDLYSDEGHKISRTFERQGLTKRNFTRMRGLGLLEPFYLVEGERNDKIVPESFFRDESILARPELMYLNEGSLPFGDGVPAVDEAITKNVITIITCKAEPYDRLVGVTLRPGQRDPLARYRQGGG